MIYINRVDLLFLFYICIYNLEIKLFKVLELVLYLLL